MLAALAGCDRVFGLGDPYEDARVSGDGVVDVALPVDVSPLEDGSGGPRLVAHFSFENTLNDDTGAYIGTDYGSGITFAIGHKGSGMLLDGTSCISVTIPDQLAAFTISFWAKPTSTMGGVAALVSRRFGVASTGYTYQIYDSTAVGGFGFELLTGTGQSDGQIPSSFAVNTWRHYAVTFDGTTKMWWLDGAEVMAQVAGPISYGSVNDEYIGCQDDIAEFFTGEIDELSFYDGAMTAQQIAALAAQ
jgi:hypothetical protein